jgi:hypothetical protein
VLVAIACAQHDRLDNKHRPISIHAQQAAQWCSDCWWARSRSSSTRSKHAAGAQPLIAVTTRADSRHLDMLPLAAHVLHRLPLEALDREEGDARPHIIRMLTARPFQRNFEMLHSLC